MGFEKNSIEVCISNMDLNSELYERIVLAKRLQGYEKEAEIAKAQQEAWFGAARLLEEAYKKCDVKNKRT